MEKKVIVAKVLAKLARKKDKEPTNWEKREKLEKLSDKEFLEHLLDKPWDALLFDKLDEKIQVELAKEFKDNGRIRNMLIGIKNLSEKAFHILDEGQTKDDNADAKHKQLLEEGKRIMRMPNRQNDDAKFDRLRRFYRD